MAPPKTKDEEGEVRPPPHHYDMARYEKVVELIEQYEAQYGGVRQSIRTRKKELEDQEEALVGTVVLEAKGSSPRLNLMEDSVLHVVIDRGNTDLALRIIRLPEVTLQGMLDYPNYYGDTPLHIAAKKGDSKVAKALLPSKDDKKRAEKRNRKGETPLHMAVLYGNLDVFNSIIELVGDEMAKDRTDDGSTILHYAIMGGQPKEALEIAHRYPDKILTRNAAGATPLHITVTFFQKPPETGFCGYINKKYVSWLTATTRKAWKIDEESGRIKSPFPEDWPWRLLPGWMRKSEFGKSMEKLDVEMSKYGMAMELVKFLALPSKDDLQKENFDFYFGGFDLYNGHKVPKIAVAAGDGEIPTQEPTADVSSGTSDPASRAGSAADELVSSMMSWTGRKAEMGDPELVKRAKKLLEEKSAAKDREISKESPLITGVKLGLDDFVIEILKVCPQFATYVGSDGMNVLQAAVKYDRREVVKAIRKDKRLPSWLSTELEPETNNNLLHIAASAKILRKEADPLRLQDQLKWFEWLENEVPKELLNYRNEDEKTARELFNEKHQATLKVSREEMAGIGRTCSSLLAAVVFTSSFYIPPENNRDMHQRVFKIFSHVYVMGFSCAATSLVMFLLLVVRPFKLRDFRRTVPCFYRLARLLLAMSLLAFIVAFACNMYLQIYGQHRNSAADLATLLLELFLVPFLCVMFFDVE